MQESVGKYTLLIGELMICLFLTLLIFISYYYLFSSETLVCKIMMAVVTTCAQIVLTELILGLLHNLFVSHLIIANCIISSAILMYAYKLHKSSILPVITKDLNYIRESITDSLDIHTLILGITVILTYTWILVAAYYLPPRGVDDLSYHLPPIFEYIQSNTIKLLPVELHQSFAFPENAELLFMWPTLFAKNQRMIDAINVSFVLASILTLFALLRYFSISRKDALFASMLYAMCPVVILQAGVNYIDILVSLFFLLSLYFSLLFRRENRISYLLTSGISIGLVLGMKYTATLLLAPLLVVLIPGIFKVKWRYSISYALLIIALSGWWYLRNYVVLNDPFYPLNLLGTAVGTSGGVSMLDNIKANIPEWISRYQIYDIGVGTYDGGFGLVFWSICYPSWLYFAVYSIWNHRKAELPRFTVLAYLPIGFLLLLAIPEQSVIFNGRFSIFVVAVGLFAYCETMKVLNNNFCNSMIKFACIIFSAISISLMFVSIQPSYRLSDLISDKINQTYTSEFKYYKNSIKTQVARRYIWEPLDFLTKDDITGLNCYVVSHPRLFAPAPVYGSKLQNHVFFTLKSVQDPIGAYVYYYYPGNVTTSNNLVWQRQIPAGIKADGASNGYDLLADNNHLVVAHSDYGWLLLHKRFFDNPDKLKLLAKYYQITWPEAIVLARQLAPVFNEAIPIITSSQIGYGLRYVDILAKKPNRIIILPENFEDTIASLKNIERCYTFNKPLSGYRHKLLSQAVYKKNKMDIYLNWKT